MKPILLAVFSFVMAACSVRSPVSYAVNLDFDKDPSRVRVTSVTELARAWGDEAVRERLRPLREALAADRDDWSLRFQQVDLDSERVTSERERGELVRVEHSGVMDRNELTHFFGDLPMTITITHDQGWTELAIYPGTTPRATRQQREVVEQVLNDWSGDLAGYLNQMSRLYSWIEAHPQMAEQAFTLLIEDDESVHAPDHEEDDLVVAARGAMSQVTARLERKNGESVPMDELFDLVYNPFPAAIVVHTPSGIIASDHFEKRGGDEAAIRHAGLLDAARTLEGTWLSPDPLALLFRADEDKFEMPKAAELAAMKRKWSENVTASEVRAALINAVKPADSYRVRWSE